MSQIENWARTVEMFAFMLIISQLLIFVSKESASSIINLNIRGKDLKIKR